MLKFREFEEKTRLALNLAESILSASPKGRQPSQLEVESAMTALLEAKAFAEWAYQPTDLIEKRMHDINNIYAILERQAQYWEEF